MSNILETVYKSCCGKGRNLYETYPYTGEYPVINTTEEYIAYLESNEVYFFMLQDIGLSELKHLLK